MPTVQIPPTGSEQQEVHLVVGVEDRGWGLQYPAWPVPVMVHATLAWALGKHLPDSLHTKRFESVVEGERHAYNGAVEAWG